MKGPLFKTNLVVSDMPDEQSALDQALDQIDAVINHLGAAATLLHREVDATDCPFERSTARAAHNVLLSVADMLAAVGAMLIGRVDDAEAKQHEA
jgi:hypothetical protein